MTAPYTSRLLNRFSALAVLAVTFIVLVYHFPIPPHIKSTSKAPESPKKISIPQTATPAYSIKPLVYIFPQYYPFPENDKIWGANFTEWDNVRKATHNVFGLETIRPHESVGYYNGLSLQTRQRQGQFIRDHGIYGAVFHHYWFAGKPVMDHVVQALLKDGEPNIPFMLSWANEPWTARWDGLDQGKIFIAQAYGTAADWKAHFDFLLPFFLHPNYIRSEGRVQFAVYKAEHMHNVGPRMFAAWRVWAKEAGFEMDIIETRWAWEKWNDGIPDAVNEFQPHVSGFDHARHPHSRRINRVYHRGTLVCWDSTPRHVTDGGGHPCPTCHPSTWQTYMVEMFKRIKEDPNPLGAENFLFINALNEWGEGNALEPSVQFGYGYGEAMLNAISISEKEHSWPDTTLKVGIERQATIKVAPTDQPDICVVAQVSPDHTNVHTFKLEALLASLQNQHNKAWRLVLFQSNDRAFGELDHIVYKFMDPRMSVVRITPELRQAYTDDDAGALGTDWIIRNLNASKSGCDNAKYVLITDGGNTYEPTAFAVTYSAATPDKMLQMNVESRHTLWDHEELQNRKWDDYCVGIMRPDFSPCKSHKGLSSTLDLTATLIPLRAFVAANHSLAAYSGSHPAHQDLALMRQLRASFGSTPNGGDNCLVRHNPSFTTCHQSGNIWFDSPLFADLGCYTPGEFEARFGYDKVDLNFYRHIGGRCLRYSMKHYPAPAVAAVAPSTPPANIPSNATFAGVV